MTKKWFSGRKVRGLSTDSKPTNPEANTEFYETDTKKTFDYTGGSWTERSSGIDIAENLTMDGKTTTFENWVTFRQGSNWSCSTTSGLTVTATGKTTGTCTYTTPSDSLITSTALEQKKSGGSWVQLSANSVSGQNITGLDEDSSYQFRTKCTNFFEDSDYTTSGSINTWIEPTTPTSCTSARDGDTTDIDVAFTGSNSGSSGLSITYAIERASDGGAFQATSQTAQAGTSWKDTTSVAGIAYTYRIIATNSAGNSAYSTTSNATTIPVNPVTGYGNAIKNPNGKLSGYNTYKFITSGNSSFTIDDTATVRVLVVGAGGSGGGTQGAGGNGGSVAWTDEYSLSAGTYTVTVGASSGGNSAFDSTTANGNGGGSSLKSGLTGDTFGMGSKGGNGCYAGGGGGGAQPQNGTSGCGGGHGGDGAVITGMEYTDYRYGGGGGGGGQAGTHAGGDHGGGNGGSDNYACGSVGTDGTGGGGGGNCSRAGGTGAVMIRVTEG